MDKPCIEWNDARSPKGYGVRRYRGKTWRVHRLAWEEQNGPIPKGVWVLHHCDNPPCYEITHLYLGTAADNARDRTSRRRTAVRDDLPQTKLSADVANEIKQRYAAGGVTQATLAAEYGVTQGAISSLLRDRKKTGTPRIKPEMVSQIRELQRSGMSQADIARNFGLNPSSVSEIVRGITHR